MLTSDTTALLHAVREGDSRAVDALLPYVYGELRRLSESKIRSEPGVVTISATGLVHEAYLRLIDAGEWQDRAHFMAVAARAMRQILTDRARARNAQKRGGAARPITLDDDVVGDEDATLDRVLAVDLALDRLGGHDAELARLVELRFFGGMEITEVAAVIGLSPRTTARRWARAKAHLNALLD